MKILHISDTHGRHRSLKNLPFADIIIHSGDVSMTGTENEMLDFVEWFYALPHKRKLFIAGNHDFYLHGANIEGLPGNCFYLCNSGVTIEGVNFYGVPMFMEDTMNDEYDKRIQKIPADTDVLITHQPPYGIMDKSGNYHYGDRNLLQIVLQIRPKYHLFGHIHGATGIEKNDNTIFVNAAMLDEQYESIRKPMLIKI